MRLQKFLAVTKATSRRKAEELIASGRVTVNGETAKLGDRITVGSDVVKIDNEIINITATEIKPSPLVLMLNKPTGYVCSHCDRYNPETIFNLLPKAFSKRKLMFCGRLDKDTEGMVLLSDDGELVQKLSHPSFGIKKHYEVILSRPLLDKPMKQMIKGIEDNGEFLQFSKIVKIGRGKMKDFVFEVVLSHGKKNEIHRMFERFGIFVKSLKRTRIGDLKLRGVANGKCRRLTTNELERLLVNSDNRRDV